MTYVFWFRSTSKVEKKGKGEISIRGKGVQKGNVQEVPLRVVVSTATNLGATSVMGIIKDRV